ncbi:MULTISPECIES: helix-turn-helix domain-containing protein [Paraburkholderia]|uniref:helix-turn-helix domain-containing protein n=1 Tax=Paraburkholderia TaxID=1822464 RepID=UPI00224F4E6C|nr:MULTISPECIES: helix-turn-helix transcriptional regulator [Paraburkholderia]MCX4177373.1 helix-turn-helix transcriptional regulator [Paraburkholderia madseniana]MDQ6465361.1 helix-turn-helix domain-containing protein [Paraburkholderia madseniana]
MDNLLIPVTLNSSQRRPIRTVRAGKREKRMSAVSTLTFRELSEKMHQRVANGETPASALPNLKSALRAFLATFGVSEDSAVGSLLRRSYYRNLRLHVEKLQVEGRDKSYIANRKSLMGKWCSLVTHLDRIEAAAADCMSPFQSTLNELLTQSQTTVAGLARAVGISKSTLGSWVKGALPNPRAVPSLKRLERFFALEPNTLLDPAYERRNFKPLESTPPTKIPYRERLATLSKDMYRLKQVSDSLAQEWLSLVVHKTEKLPDLRRYPRGVWVTTDLIIEKETDRNWYCFTKGRFVPTAKFVWEVVTSYLGWLTRARQLGGAGLTCDDVQTLAWLSNAQMAHRYLKWRIERAGDKVHAGVLDFAKLIGSLNHPQHGYLTQMPELRERLPEAHRPRVWQDACLEAHAWASKTNKNLSVAGIEHSREPMAPIKSVLELDDPLEAVADMISRMKSCRPTTGGISEVVWARDLLLVKLMTSNPLRAKNMKLLTYRADNTGNIYRRPDGSWFIRIEKRAFKNARGAARSRDYDMPVNRVVWGDIERYLHVYRPMLPDADKVDFVFLSTSEEQSEGYVGVWKSMNKRIFFLTHRYLWDCPGIGAHGFRYIIGTATLKKAPGAWDAAAAVLHDEVDTVKAHYAHLRPSDGGNFVHKLLDSAFARM